MKTKLLILALLFSLNSLIFGQICGTSPYSNENLQQKSNSLKSSNIQYLSTSTSICVNVKYHIVRESNGTGGFNISNLNNVTNRLNEAFNEHKIYFNNIGYEIINNSTYYNIDDPQGVYTEFNALVQINNAPNAINIYLVNNAEAYAGRANGILSQALVIENYFATTPVISHEVGHCFNLYHTHRGTWQCERSSSTCIEVDGVNNSTCGDKVADTPADPGLLAFDSTCSNPVNYLVDGNCNYIGGNGYNPDTNNIMSYAPSYCLQHFTAGQNTRIRQAFESYSVLQQVVSSSCAVPELNGSSTVCNSNTTYTLQNGGSSVTWQVSSNLQIVSSNNTSITVISQWANGSGQGFIKAILPYETIQKDVWVGKADLDIVLFSNGIGETDYWCTSHTGNYYELFPKLDGTTHEIRLKKYPNLNIVYSSSTNYYGDEGPFYYTPLPGWYLFEVRRTNSCGTSDWFGYEVEFVDCSQQGGGESEYSIYPNPTSETLTIEKLNNNQTLQIDTFELINIKNSDSFELYDFNTNIIKKGVLNNQTIIDVSTYKRGRYFLKINSKGKSRTHHIIIQ